MLHSRETDSGEVRSFWIRFTWLNLTKWFTHKLVWFSSWVQLTDLMIMKRITWVTWTAMNLLMALSQLVVNFSLNDLLCSTEERFGWNQDMNHVFSNERFLKGKPWGGFRHAQISVVYTICSHQRFNTTEHEQRITTNKKVLTLLSAFVLRHSVINVHYMCRIIQDT